MSDADKIQPDKARYIMIGGFLGSGKTTAIAQMAQRLTDQGYKVGLITNDQGNELVDTAMLRSRGFATEEIPGGCFCCRFNSLVDAAQKLNAESRPDVFIAEPVGSCTDLVATVSYPLRRMYGEDFRIAPLSVLVDPVRAARVFELNEGGRFSDKVRYIYKKQLEEADVIVINKCDILEDCDIAMLGQRLNEEYPNAQIFEASARDGRGLNDWFAHLWDAEQQARMAMEIDYAIYAEGEALLGWLNCTAKLSSETEFDANKALRVLCKRIQVRLAERDGEIAHLKMTFSPSEGLSDIAVVNLVRNDYVSELSQELDDAVSSGQLIINMRAEAAPETLNEAVEHGLTSLRERFPGLETTLEHAEYFRPGKPEPTHRIADPNA